MNAFATAIARAKEKGWKEGARRMELERRMASALVRACLDKGYLISVNDGEDWAIKQSDNYRKIMDVLWATDEETVVIYGIDGQRLGFFFLVYGNDGYDLIADYTDNDACNAIWNEVIKPLADRMEMGR